MSGEGLTPTQAEMWDEYWDMRKNGEIPHGLRSSDRGTPNLSSLLDLAYQDFALKKLDKSYLGILGIGNDGKLFKLGYKRDTPSANRHLLIDGGDAAQNTGVLKLVAKSVYMSNDLRRRITNGLNVTLRVITAHPDEWLSVVPGNRSWKECVIPSLNDMGPSLISDIYNWASSNHASRKECQVLFVDNMRWVMQMDSEFRSLFRWLISRGALRGVKIVATGEPNNTPPVKGMTRLDPWIELFNGQHIVLQQTPDPSVYGIQIEGNRVPKDFIHVTTKLE